MNTPTDNAWLDEVLRDCVNHAYEVMDAKSFADPYSKAKAAILTHIDTVCREAVVAELNYVRKFGERGGHDVYCRTIGEALLDRIAELAAQTQPLNPNKDTI